MRIAIVAGELSGDRLGAGVMQAVWRRRPDIRFEGVAGPKMLAAGCRAFYAADQLAVMGLTEVISHLPRLLRMRRDLIRRWRQDPPQLLLGIDAPDFNLGLEARLRAAGIATVHYVCPSVWAWRQGRVRKIRRAADRVLCLLPFEQEFLQRHGVRADFVGHPLADELADNIDAGAARSALGLGPGPHVAILPGSRLGEVVRLGDAFLKTALWLAERRPDLSFIAAMAGARVEAQFRSQLAAIAPGLPISIVTGRTHDALAASDAVLIASGTATLEAALCRIPMIVAYSVSPATYRLVKSLRLMKIDRYALPNLLAGRDLVPEFIQSAVEPAAMGAALLNYLEDPEMRAALIGEFAKLHTTLARDADERAADAILSMIDAGGG